MRILLSILFSVVCVVSFAGQSEVRDLFRQVDSMILETSKTAAKCRTTQDLTAVLKRNDVACKNLIKVSSAPDDFKKALTALVNQYKFVAAILIILTTQNRELTNDETKQVKAWDKQYRKCCAIAEKYGYKHQQQR